MNANGLGAAIVTFPAVAVIVSVLGFPRCAELTSGLLAFVLSQL